MNGLKNIFWFVLWLCPLLVFSQRSGVGRWQDHYSYNNVLSIVVLRNEISGVTENGLFFFNPRENSIRRKTTVQGLSGVGITASAYDPSTRIQIVGYEDGNIDLVLQNGRVVNIPDLQRWQTPGSKRINKIVIENSQRVFLCTDFGIVVVNLNRREISETYFIGENNSHLQVRDIAFSNDSIFAATENGLKRAYRRSRRLSNFREWEQVLVNSQIERPIESVSTWNDNLIVHQRSTRNDQAYDTIWRRDSENEWHILDTISTSKIKVSNNRLFQLRRKPDVDYLREIREFNSDFQILRRFGSNSQEPDLWGLVDFEVDVENNLWLSTGFNGLTRLTPNWMFVGDILPRGPASNNVYSLTHSLTTLYSANGNVNAGDWSPGWRTFAVDFFRNGNWELLESRHLPGGWVADAVAVAENPSNPNVFVVASWHAGVVQRNADRSVTIFDSTNSTLKPFWDGWQYITRIGDVNFDRRNQLWATMTRGEHHLHRRAVSGEWTAFDLGHLIPANPTSDAKEFIVDYHNQLWIRTRWGGLVFFREYNNSAGFQALRANLTRGNDQQITVINTLVEDRRGYVWLGTDRGILVNYTSRQLFNNPVGLESTVEFRTVNYAGRPLLENENVTAIAVDGADRKWFGTSSSGVFLMSADGREMLRHYTAQNSPLNSNTITALAINPRTGTVYIGTDRGLMSYGGDATVGNRTEQNIVVIPNPVRADFTGEISIQGLVENAHVRITDVSGVLVFETTARGGMATWNGKTRNGQRVRPGVYLVFATNDDGSVGSVGRIFFSR
ncbi:MAG: hypothetical protein FWD02_01970 [Bacteroidales bacterium]|nr:hypothetical protein [Bacteroidales bacterium]